MKSTWIYVHKEEGVIHRIIAARSGIDGNFGVYHLVVVAGGYISRENMRAGSQINELYGVCPREVRVMMRVSPVHLPMSMGVCSNFACCRVGYPQLAACNGLPFVRR